MESISVFDIYKIGVGPSSSHTLGPWKAALDFTTLIKDKVFDKVEIQLFGSLSKTGKGHATDLAVQLGLAGYQPETIDTEKIPEIIKNIATTNQLAINGKEVFFMPKSHILFRKQEKRSHPNTLIFKAFSKGKIVCAQVYLSVGGGFIQKEDIEVVTESVKFPYPIDKGADLINHLESTGLSISDIVYKNEQALLTTEQIDAKLTAIFKAMKACVYRGCTKDGILPGGLGVVRRAKGLCDSLINEATFDSVEEWERLIFQCPREFNVVNKWVSCFALAVNEENAAMGRVVTSPTNGAAGVIPAVMFYYYFFCVDKSSFDMKRFLLTSGEIGSLFKKGATLSAAVGGCQAEIGVSSAMAAGGLTEVLGGTPEQVLMAAEIAMEHHLGLTCDPIGGLVQIPCIERNAMGAMKAITACNLALSSNPKNSKVNLDMVIKTMWDTALAMNKKYKETSEGGLAYNLPVINPEC